MSISFAYSSAYLPPAPVVQLTLVAERETSLEALLDTGADATMIPISALIAIQARFVRTHRMRGVIGPAQAVQLYQVAIQIGPYTIPAIRAIAADEDSPAILGRDVLNHLIVTLDGIAGTTEVS
jgi:predicted aspartyl protease